MKILYVDPRNIRHNFYNLVRLMHRKGVESALVVSINLHIDAVERPGIDDSDNQDNADNGLPSWLIREEFPYVSFRKPFQQLKHKRELKSLLKEWDIVVCTGESPIVVSETGKPFIFFSFGADLDQLAVQGWTGNQRDKIGLKNKIRGKIVSRKLQSALREASRVVVAPYQLETARRLELRNLIFLPHIIDTEVFSPMEQEEKIREREKIRAELDCGLIFLHPPRQVWTDSALKDCKGNDILYRAFAKFLAESRCRAKLIVFEHGWDIDKSKELIASLGIEEHVVWKKAVRRRELRWFYNVSDMVFDQFVWGIFALVAVEGMSCGTPVCTNLGQTPPGLFYEEKPPVLDAVSEEDVYNALRLAAEDKETLRNLGLESRDWIVRNCHWEVVVEQHLQLYNEILREASI